MSAHTELAARMPWTVAQPETWWDVTGTYGKGCGTFTNCLARVIPPMITGNDEPLFEILLYGGAHCVTASAITRGVELMFVYANEPLTAYYPDDQATIDAAVSR